MTNIESLLQDSFLQAFDYNVNTYNRILNKIRYTGNYIYGKEILYVNINDDNNLETIEKPLKNLYVDMTISKTALRACNKSANALVLLLSEEMKQAATSASKLLIKLICDEIKKELNIKTTKSKIISTLNKLYDTELEQIKICQLCPWRFLPSSENSITFDEKEFQKYTLVKYCNVIFPRKILLKLQENLK